MFNPLNPPSSPASSHYPIGLICLALAGFLLSQIVGELQNDASLKWQKKNLLAQASELEKAEARLGELVKQRETLVGQSEKVKADYMALLGGLLELAKTDADARKIVEKWGIQMQGANPKAPATTTPSAPAAPAFR